MSKFSCITGRLTEVQRYINVPMRICEQHPSRERREFWVQQDDGQEVKLVVHSRSMPARRGHTVSVLLRGEVVVGLVNHTKREGINFLVADPPWLFTRCDALRTIATAVVGSLVWGDDGWLLPIVCAVGISGLLLIGLRAVGRSRSRSAVETWAAALEKPSNCSMPALRRIK